MLFQQLEEIRSIYVVESGLVELSVVSKMGDTKVISYCGDGVVIGEMGLYQKYINSTQAMVLKKSKLNVISIAEGRQKIFNDPELAALLYESLATKLQLTTNQLGITLLDSTVSKIASILLDFNESEVHLTQEKLADSVGCSRITITRHLGFLEEQGIIKNERGKIIILNRPALKKLI